MEMYIIIISNKYESHTAYRIFGDCRISHFNIDLYCNYVYGLSYI